MRYFCLLVIVFMTPAGYADLKSEMTDSQYAEAGMHKLTDKEREALYVWVQAARGIATHEARSLIVPEPAQEPAPQSPVFSSPRPVPISEFNTHIVGAFTGWEGKTRFRLANGQTWQQRTMNRYRYRAEDPDVRLKKNFLGFWEMEILETGRSVGVKQVK